MTILFVCTGNTCRSPMAEALLNKALSDWDVGDVEVASAGLYADAGMGASMGALGAMASRGIDLTAHRATQLTRHMVEQADLVLAMGPSHVEGVRALGGQAELLMRYATGEDAAVADPFGGDEGVYEIVAGQLERAIQGLGQRMGWIRS